MLPQMFKEFKQCGELDVIRTFAFKHDEKTTGIHIYKGDYFKRDDKM